MRGEVSPRPSIRSPKDSYKHILGGGKSVAVFSDVYSTLYLGGELTGSKVTLDERNIRHYCRLSIVHKSSSKVLTESDSWASVSLAVCNLEA